MPVYLVAFGGNVETAFGSPVATMQTALTMIVESGVRITATSPIFHTPAFPVGSGPEFANGVFSAEDPREPREFLSFLHKVEAEFGRQRVKRWGTRTLDLDILASDGLILPDEETWRSWYELPLHEQIVQTPAELILPHPRLQDRAFVLVPLAEIAPNWRHPVLKLTARQMRDDLPKKLLDEVKPA